MGPNVGNPEITCQSNINGAVITSGGGFSTYWLTPSWQTTALNNYYSTLTAHGITPAAGYNPKGRGFPDVSFLGVDYPLIINNAFEYECGTSASSPVFAAMISLINAFRHNQSKGSVGESYCFLYLCTLFYLYFMCAM